MVHMRMRDYEMSAKTTILPAPHTSVSIPVIPASADRSEGSTIAPRQSAVGFRGKPPPRQLLHVKYTHLDTPGPR